jgi:hypothetical protein
MNQDVFEYVETSVLCWLATSSLDNMPNVSPKEVFTEHNGNVIIANIASPQSVRNIQENPNVCVSFIDIFIQKGYQLKGHAEIIFKESRAFDLPSKKLEKITNGKFPFESITQIKITSTKPIIAPSYLLYPEISEKDRINSAKQAYGLSQ